MAWEYYGDRLVPTCCRRWARIPPCPTIRLRPCSASTPRELFRVHDWRNDIVTLGEVPGEFMHEVSEGKLNFPWPAQVNKLLSGWRATI